MHICHCCLWAVMPVVSAIWRYQEIGWHPLSSFILLTPWNHEIIYCQGEWNTRRILDWFIFNFTLFLPASIMPPGSTHLLYPDWHCNLSTSRVRQIHSTRQLFTHLIITVQLNLHYPPPSCYKYPCHYQAPTHNTWSPPSSIPHLLGSTVILWFISNCLPLDTATSQKMCILIMRMMNSSRWVGYTVYTR